MSEIMDQWDLTVGGAWVLILLSVALMSQMKCVVKSHTDSSEMLTFGSYSHILHLIQIFFLDFIDIFTFSHLAEDNRSNQDQQNNNNSAKSAMTSVG